MGAFQGFLCAGFLLQWAREHSVALCPASGHRTQSSQSRLPADMLVSDKPSLKGQTRFYFHVVCFSVLRLELCSSSGLHSRSALSWQRAGPSRPQECLQSPESQQLLHAVPACDTSGLFSPSTHGQCLDGHSPNMFPRLFFTEPPRVTVHFLCEGLLAKPC